MQRYLLRRILLALVTLLAVSLIIFVMSRAAGDPRHVYLDDYSTQEDWDRLTATLGLDKPYYQQYGIFLGSALRGDFGQSIKEGRPSMEVIVERVPATLQLGLAAFAFSVIVGVPLGILSAVKRGSFLDMTGKVVALVGQSAPVFWLGLMLVFLFSVRWNDWFGDSLVPPYGRQEITSIILPAVTLGWFYAAANLRLLRVGHAQRPGLRIREVGASQGRLQQHRDLEALVAQRAHSRADFRRHNPGQPGHRFAGRRNRVRVAGIRTAGDPGPGRQRLPTAAGRGDRVHVDVRDRGPAG